MRWALATIAAIACSSPAGAQEQADRARIDDFTVPAAEPADDAGIEQLDPDAAPLTPAAPVPLRDPTAPQGAATSADSAPRPAAPIVGTDRCDPQAESADSAKCSAILETRAGDFAATAPATLSAEQALIASQRAQSMRQDPATANRRVRQAGTGAADDELRGNQELATIYLDRQRQLSTRPAEPTPVEVPEALAEMVEPLRQAEGAGP